MFRKRIEVHWWSHGTVPARLALPLDENFGDLGSVLILPLPSPPTLGNQFLSPPLPVLLSSQTKWG